MYETINEEIKNLFYDNPSVKQKLAEYEKLVNSGKMGSLLLLLNY